MKKHSRRYRAIKEHVPNNKHYSVAESLNFLQNNNREKLKNIKASFSLNWANQKNILKSKIILPHPLPPKGKLAIIKEDLPTDIVSNLTKNEQVELLTVAEVRQKTEKKKKSHETKLKTLEKILAPKGAFPNKKNGSLTENILTEVEKFQQGEKEIKTDKGGNIHAVIGSSDFSRKQLEANFKTIYDTIINLQPVGGKGEVLKNITISTTMGPGLKILSQK
ncbi:3068_t:CDS:2 [Ambispora gerdemannii]|uniref:3068_t:CDS:1 n=1 Tax=Ambispora gerdemannii TaxID=144530 RepID=A0A9N9GVT5_9GLOM|nr:3068_t:CDS:2 [Ambispora gerdemannii]